MLLREKRCCRCVKQHKPAALFPNYARGSRDVHKAIHVVAHRIMLRGIMRRPHHWKLTGGVLCIFSRPARRAEA
jgi:hypothetical protein